MNKPQLWSFVFLLTTTISCNHTPQSPSSVVRRESSKGEDFTVYSQVTSATNASGRTSYTTNRFTLLENGLNYFEKGEWKLSEDRIESVPEGAVARRGPHKTIFGHDLNTDAVFDISAPDGTRLRGGVRAIQLTDLATGKSVVLGTVKGQAPGELLPPNQIVFRDAFEGVVRADVVIVWKHNFFAQDVVLRSRPRLPDGMSPESTVLEVVTEFINPPQPELRQQAISDKNQPDFLNDIVIYFGRLAMIGGKAFAVDPDAGYIFDRNPSSEGTLVRKRWHKLPDGSRTFLLESIAWNDLRPHMDQFRVPQADATTPLRLNNERIWPRRLLASTQRKPLPLASTEYRPEGFVVDWVILPDSSPTTFYSTENYVVRTTYYNGSSATFKPGCVIKFWGNNGANMVLYGSVSFENGANPSTFTSLDDNTIGGVWPGLPDLSVPKSDGNPTDNLVHTPLSIWYVNHNTLIQNAVFRWSSQYGIYYFNTGNSANHTVRNCRFEKVQNGGTAAAVYAHIPAARSVTLINSTACEVDNVSGADQGSVIGDLPQSCKNLGDNVLVNDPAKDANTDQDTQSETSLIAFGNTVVVAYVDSNAGVPGYGFPYRRFTCSPPCDWSPSATPQFIGWAVSTTGGTSFEDKGNILPPFQGKGNAGDPVLARDNTTGRIYLIGNPQRPSYYLDSTLNKNQMFIPLWRSDDNGQTFGAPVNAGPGRDPTGTVSRDIYDKPALVVDNLSGTGRGNVYASFVWQKTTGNFKILVYHSIDGGDHWAASSSDLGSTGSAPGLPTLALGTNHEVYIVWSETSGIGQFRFFFSKSTDQGKTFSTGVPIVALEAADLDLTRSSSAFMPYYNDTFRTPVLPNLIVNQANGHLYLVYADKVPSPSYDRGDIYFAQSTDGGAHWTSPIRVNSDSGIMDQWQPVITVKPDGSKLFIAWYDRRNSQGNYEIQTYGVVATLPVIGTSSFANNFAISAVKFVPAFTGSQTTPGSYDPVYPPDSCTVCPSFGGIYAEHMGDYDTAVSDNSYIYYTWGDNRNISRGRYQADVRFVKMQWP
jgi:hypothetical protein